MDDTRQDVLGVRELRAELNGRLDALIARFDGFIQIMNERDLRYTERDRAAKEAVRAALVSALQAAEKTETALKEYKVGANEWRDTVKDLTSKMVTHRDREALEAQIVSLRESRSNTSGQSVGRAAMWGYIASGAGAMAAVGTVLLLILKFLTGVNL
ncbi:MAG: hypothetical protein NUV51_09245 [Sulfuricaulis sp.]|nr:hypothetical protein [Sulfuricaulis sp.]